MGSEERVLGSTFKTKYIQGPGDKKQPAEEWSERWGRQQGDVASPSQERVSRRELARVSTVEGSQ